MKPEVNSREQEVSGLVHRNAQEIHKGLRPRTIPGHDIVRMQVGTLALASMSQSGRL